MLYFLDTELSTIFKIFPHKIITNSSTWTILFPIVELNNKTHLGSIWV
jgi:hypothetical protein